MTNDLVVSPAVSLLKAENMPSLLGRIRPQWQAKNLIDRVKKLAEVDPSSACQRIFNAAIHDLREKIVLAGIDIAREAAVQNKLPPVEREEDVENYSTARVIDLAFRMGLLTRPDWRRLSRCYEIRRDLEHEDDEYEAGIEDIVYIFQTCVDVVLAKDPIQLVRLTDFKDLVEEAQASVPDDVLIEDFASAPQPRQTEICKFLISTALDKNQPDLVQQNAFTALGYVAPKVHPHVRTALGSHLQEKVGRTLTDRQARVANVAGLMPYIRQAARTALFDAVFSQMQKTTYDWSGYPHHGELLRTLEEYGGLAACPLQPKRKIVWWLILTYIGKPGGVTQYGNVRKVFYSNTAAPLIKGMIIAEGPALRELMEDLSTEKRIKAALSNQDVARRFEDLLDLVEDK